MSEPHAERPVVRVTPAGVRAGTDTVAVEEPLGIWVTFGPPRERRRANLGVTLRTPGHDRDLAAGFLLSEGVVSGQTDIVAMTVNAAGTTVRVELRPDVLFDPARFARRTVRSTACGACGRAALDAADERFPGPAPGGTIAGSLVPTLPDVLRAAQGEFAATGGTHAAGLFDLSGRLLGVREDVGRHNALDKLLGAELLAGRVPLAGRAVVVSGRAGFELVQKCAAAGVPVLVAVGAPTTLAVDLAGRLGVTLVGFARAGRFNVYAHTNRVTGG